MSLRVLEPGLQTLVVDFGRPHCRSLGVPVGGAADRTSLALGNALLGNPPDAAALEFCLNGPVLEAQCEVACVVYGAPFDMKSTRQKLRVGTTFLLKAGEMLEIGGTSEDMRAYLCVAGGLKVKAILGSHSGLDAIQKDTLLECNSSTIPRRFAKIEWHWDPNAEEARRLTKMFGFPVLGKAKPFRFIDGPQSSLFPADGLIDIDPDAFVRAHFTVRQASDRMGVRLQRWEPLPVPDGELVSEPVCPGSVQVTRDGQCIILGVDGQTIGGYPKIAQVISADLDRLGQLRPGDALYFQRVTLDEAERLWRARQRELHHWITRMQVSLPGISPMT
jgi:antagonist of KipI